MIHQGDAYSIPINIKIDNESVTPDDVEGVKVKIGDVEKTYPDGGLTYDTESGNWIFGLTQKHSLSMIGLVPVQTSVKIEGSIINSEVSRIEICKSIIVEEWSNE